MARKYNMMYLCGFIVIYLLHIIEGSFVHSPTEIPHDEAVDFCKTYGHHHRLVDDNTNHTSLSIYMKNVNVTHAWMAFKRHQLQDWTWLDGTMGSDALAGLDTSGRVCGGIAVVDRSRRPMRCNYGGDHEGYICQYEGTGRCAKSEPCFMAENTTYTFDCGVNDFYRARMLCAEMGMTLAKMDTEEKVSRFAEKKSEFPHFALCSFFWIGLRMEDWQTENKVIHDSHWQEGQPEHQGNCAVGQVTSDKVMWETVNCNLTRVAVCEISTVPTVADPDISPDATYHWIIYVLAALVVLTVLIVCAGVFYRRKNNIRNPEYDSSRETYPHEPTEEAEEGLLASSQEATENNPTSAQSQATLVEDTAIQINTMSAEGEPLTTPECNAEQSSIIPRHRNADHQDLNGTKAEKEESAESAAKCNEIENHLTRIRNNLDTTYIDLQVLSSPQTKQVYEDELRIGSGKKIHNELIKRILNIDLGHLKRNVLDFINITWNTFDNSASDNRKYFLDEIKKIKEKKPDIVIIIDLPVDGEVFDSEPWKELVNSYTVLTADRKAVSKQNRCQTAISVGIFSDLTQKRRDVAAIYAPVNRISGSSGKVFSEVGPWFVAMVSAIVLMYAGNKYDERYPRLRSSRSMHGVLTDLCDQTKTGKKKILLLKPWDTLSDKEACEELINKHAQNTAESTSV